MTQMTMITKTTSEQGKQIPEFRQIWTTIALSTKSANRQQKDASIDCEYFLHVHPHIRTAHQGVAWTFGYDNPADYQPDKET